MIVKLSELEPNVLEFLKRVQSNPEEHVGYYQSDGSKTLAVFGLILAFAIVPAAFIAPLENFPVYAWIIALCLVSWMGLASWSYITRFKAASPKPFIFVNPLYFTRVGIDEVCYHHIWNERKAFNAVHHYTNGVYSHTAFEFQFTDGSSEHFNISPKKKADDFNQMIANFGVQVADALESEDYQALASHDIFFHQKQKTPFAEVGDIFIEKEPNILFRALILGAVLGGCAYLFQTYNYQARVIRYTNSITGIRYFMKEFSPNFFVAEAKDKIYDLYQEQFKKNKNSAKKLREMMKLASCSELDKKRESEILKLYKDGSKKALVKLYELCLKNYKKISQKNNPEEKAQNAILQILKAARDKGFYHVKISYVGKSSGINKTFYTQVVSPVTKKKVKKKIEAMASSFSPVKNSLREQAISTRIKQSFQKIIPQDILAFGSTGKIEFKLSYVVYPSKYIYFFTKQSFFIRKYYQGVKFLWNFQILLEGKPLYQFTETSAPPAKFKVKRNSFMRRYMSKKKMAATSVYDRMAETSFDNFSRKILKHFGIMKSIRQEQADYLALQLGKNAISRWIKGYQYKDQSVFSFSWLKEYSRGVKSIQYSWDKPTYDKYWVRNGKGSHLMITKKIPASRSLYLKISLANNRQCGPYHYVISPARFKKAGYWYVFMPSK